MLRFLIYGEEEIAINQMIVSNHSTLAADVGDIVVVVLSLHLQRLSSGKIT